MKTNMPKDQKLRGPSLTQGKNLTREKNILHKIKKRCAQAKLPILLNKRLAIPGNLSKRVNS